MAHEVAVRPQQSLDQLAAGVLMVGFPQGPIPDETRALARAGVRSFILFARNVRSRDVIRSLTADLQTASGGEALIAIDHEGGRVMRLAEAATPWPSPMAWAATYDPALARRAAQVAAQELASLGINLNFAPVADVFGDYRNPVLSTRCFSDDPRIVAEFVTAFVRGHQEGGAAATAKHFPGHGYTPIDSHVDLPRVERTTDELRDADIIPFAAAIEAGVDCLMVSHVWYSSLDGEPTPASTSPRIMRLARGDLGYDGVIVTDCLEMGAVQRRMGSGEAVVRAIAAGADLAIVSHRADRQREAIDALTAAARSGDLPVERLVEANRRLDTLRDRVVRPHHGPPDGGLALAQAIAQGAITLVRDDDGILPLRPASIGVVAFNTDRTTQVEEVGFRSMLGTVARRHAQDVIEIEGMAGRDSVLRHLHDVDTVLIGVARAFEVPEQADTVRAILRSGKPVVVIGLRDPFDLTAFPESRCFLAAYGDGELEMEAALAVLFGEAQPTGRLPVALPGLYPRGHGLSRTGE